MVSKGKKWGQQNQMKEETVILCSIRYTVCANWYVCVWEFVSVCVRVRVRVRVLTVCPVPGPSLGQWATLPCSVMPLQKNKIQVCKAVVGIQRWIHSFWDLHQIVWETTCSISVTKWSQGLNSPQSYRSSHWVVNFYSKQQCEVLLVPRLH